MTRARVYLTDIEPWPDAGRAHGEIFADVQPTRTSVEISRLVLDGHGVEIELTAVVQ